jgi:hypothetical protein
VRASAPSLVSRGVPWAFSGFLSEGDGLPAEPYFEGVGGNQTCPQKGEWCALSMWLGRLRRNVYIDGSQPAEPLDCDAASTDFDFRAISKHYRLLISEWLDLKGRGLFRCQHQLPVEPGINHYQQFIVLLIDAQAKDRPLQVIDTSSHSFRCHQPQTPTIEGIPTIKS